MIKYFVGFLVYYLIGFFYILFLPKSEKKFDGYLLGVIVVAFFWPFVLLMRILGFIRIAFETFIQKRKEK